MRHNFTNDIGDYAKYSLLRIMCSSAEGRTLKLGVIWYLTEHMEQNGDGRHRAHLSQDGWDRMDPALLQQMRAIESGLRSPDDLHLSLIERSAILPPGTVYFSEPLRVLPGSRAQRLLWRAEWFADAKKAVANCDFLFLDPDNGLEVKSVGPAARLAGKYVTVAEMTELLALGSLVILYQHCDRSPWQVQRAKVCATLRRGSGQHLYIRTVRFGAFGARAFFCLTTDRGMAKIMDAGLAALAERVANWDRAHTLLFE